jgi:hypothetical protein
MNEGERERKKENQKVCGQARKSRGLSGVSIILIEMVKLWTRIIVSLLLFSPTTNFRVSTRMD